jgi:hypothetical protein
MRGRDVLTSDVRVRQGPSPAGLAGRREAGGLPGAAEVGLILGAL